MARLPRIKIETVSRALRYVTDKLNDANEKLAEELDPQSKLDATYKGNLDGGANADARDAIKMIRWLVEDNLGLTPPAAYTEAEVDAIDAEIRTFDDGT